MLSREVLVWIQGLDLSYSVRNPRRDFGNGFFVAEILSRYFPKVVHMHSFDNGLSLAKKQDNWRQLETIFAKVGFELPEQQHAIVVGVMESEMDAVEKLINSLYNFLTKREVNAKTAPSVLKTFKRQPKQRYGKESKTSDETDKRLEGRSEDEEHDRDLSKPSMKSSKILRGETRQMCQIPAEKRVHTGQVNIKTFDSDIMKIRAAKSFGSETTSTKESKISMKASEEVVEEAKVSFLVSPLGLLEEAIESVMGSKSGFSTSNFLEEGDDHTMLSAKDQDAIISFLFAKRGVLSDVILASTMEWTKISSRIAMVRSRIAFDLLIAIGEHVASKDPRAALSLFFETLAPTLVNRVELVDTVHAFIAYAPTHGPEEHVEGLRKVKQLIGDEESRFFLFLHLVIVEERKRGTQKLQQNLQKFLLECCFSGVRSPSARARCAAISILSFVAEKGNAEPAFMLNQVRNLQFDPWWETKAQLLDFSTKLLSLENAEEADHSDDVVLFLHDLLGDPNQLSSETKKLACAFLAPLLDSFHCLASCFIRAFVSIEDDQSRKMLLGISRHSSERGSIVVEIPSVTFGPSSSTTILAPVQTWDPSVLLATIRSEPIFDFDGVLRLSEAQLVQMLLSSWLEDDVDPDVKSSFCQEIFDVISAPFIRSFIANKNDKAAISILTNLLFKLAEIQGVNVFAHPMWPEALHDLYGHGDEEKARIYDFTNRIQEALSSPNKELAMSVKVLFETLDFHLD